MKIEKQLPYGGETVELKTSESEPDVAFSFKRGSRWINYEIYRVVRKPKNKGEFFFDSSAKMEEKIEELFDLGYNFFKKYYVYDKETGEVLGYYLDYK